MAFQTGQKPVNITLYFKPHWEQTLLERCPYSEFSGPYFPAFGLNTERYRVEKIRTRKTPNMDTFQAVKP